MTGSAPGPRHEGVHDRASSFEGAAESYERGRPGWPEAAIDAVRDRLGLSRDSAVLDLAAGTGKLTRQLVPRFAEVIAVEPLGGMRAVLERAAPGARALSGTAEAIPLEDGSVDAVLVAEAIHWFDAPRAAAEMARVLRPGGGVAVLYNRLGDPDADWRREARAIFDGHRLPDDDVDPHATGDWRAALEDRIGPLRDDVFEHRVALDADGIVALYGSFSVIAGLPPERRDAALAAIRAVLARNGILEAELTYRTEVTTAGGA